MSFIQKWSLIQDKTVLSCTLETGVTCNYKPQYLPHICYSMLRRHNDIKKKEIFSHLIIEFTYIVYINMDNYYKL